MADAKKWQHDGATEGLFADRPAEAGQPADSSDASGCDIANVFAPPAPPNPTLDYQSLAREAARIRAQEAARAHAAKRRRITALCIAVAGVALVIVGAVAALLLTHPSLESGDGGLAESPVADGNASSANESSQGSSESGSDAPVTSEGSVSAVEAVVAADQISADFASLVADEDGVFTGFVQSFMDDYDQGVNTEVSYTLAGLDVQAEELAQSLLAGFSCTVTNVDVQGQTAWVNVDVTSKSLADQADAFAQVVESGASEAQDEEAYKAFLKQAYLESLDAASPRSHSLLVTVSRTDDGWTVTEGTMEYILGSVWYTSA